MKLKLKDLAAIFTLTLLLWFIVIAVIDHIMGM